MASRRLVLVRHAKAEADRGANRERRLATRGERDAREVGRWLAEHGLVPDRVVVSPARRARQTWQLAASELAAGGEPVLDERIYDNTPEDLLDIIRETPEEVTTLVLVGHNPSIAALAVTLDDGAGDAAARQDLTRKYPTSGVAVFALSGGWTQIDAGTGRLLGFGVPRG